MRKAIISLLLLVAWATGMGSNWVEINGNGPAPATIRLISSTVEKSIVQFSFSGFSASDVQTPLGLATRIGLDRSTPVLNEGAPELPKLTTSLVIPDLDAMKVTVVASQYQDYPGMLIAPSKGVLMRDTDPSQVPYTYGKAYSENRFFPGELAGMRDPFIVRDLRGQSLVVYPFQYNPVTRVLRVYYDLTVEVTTTGQTGYNPLVRKTPLRNVHPEFDALYKRAFLNYSEAVTDYTPLNDYGKTLVLCYGTFMADMQAYVNWKNSIGYPTTLVDVATAGTTAAAIKTYIANYYNTNGLTFVLLVGDNAQIPTNQGAGLGGPSDNAYGYITGNDHYPEVFIGRFSAETAAQVQTQVQRTINYEKNPAFPTDDWLSTVLGIGSDQGPGDDNEYDYQHIRNQQTQLLAYTYTSHPELFDGSQGGNDANGNPTPAMVSTEVNSGTGLILYTGHGSSGSWGTTGFSSTNVNALTNQGKLPFIWSVACVNGEFMNGTCFAESWLRASQGGQPTGAMAFLGSTINQSWNSPMEGQDEMTNILVETYPTNIKRTFAGLSINGCMKMIEAYGSDGQNMADTWTVFGDPTLQVRTKAPLTLTVTHDQTLFVGTTSLHLTCNMNGARATASLNNTMLATGLVENNNLTLNFPALPAPNDSVKLIVTAYNHLPYMADIPIITPNGPYVLYLNSHANDTTGNNNDLVDYGEEIQLTLYMKNVGIEATTSALNVKLRSNDPFVTLTDTTELYGVIAPNQVKSVLNGYRFQTANAVPDGHAIPFSLIATDGTNTWTSGCSLTAHSPVMGYSSVSVNDQGAVQNGALDPGETALLGVSVTNTGSSAAQGVNVVLIPMNPYVTITTSQVSYGNMNAGQVVSKDFEIMVDEDAPEGQMATFLVQITAERGISGSGTFDLVIGKIPLLVVDFDGNTNSGPAFKSAAEALGMPAEYNTTSIPDDLSQYTSIFVCLGIYSDNHVLTSAEGQKLATYLNGGGRLYMEGGDTWKYDPQTAVHPMFGLTASDDGSGDLGTLNGQTGTFTAGLSYAYSGDNSYIDHISANSPALNIFQNASPAYYTAVANDAGTYRTIGSSFEFGGLTDGAGLSTRQHLMEEYLNFFGIQPPPLVANFAAFPTNVAPGSSVSFTDYSTGAANSWSWSFPGGTPATSTEQNPVVTYSSAGIFDVQLIVHTATDTDTILKTDYITVENTVGTGPNTGMTGCTVWPNPGNGLFRLSLTGFETKADASVTGASGVTVWQGSVSNGSSVIDLTGQPQGVYILKIRGENGTVTRKLVIRR